MGNRRIQDYLLKLMAYKIKSELQRKLFLGKTPCHNSTNIVKYNGASKYVFDRLMNVRIKRDVQEKNRGLVKIL